MALAASLKDRLMSRVNYTPYGCWEWGGHITAIGYGKVGWCKVDGAPAERLAHRVSYGVFVGPITDGHCIDHLCRNRCCINPTHLEAVTPKENIRRGMTGKAKTNYCPQGHEFTPENTVLENTGFGRTSRRCRECKLAKMRRWYSVNGLAYERGRNRVRRKAA